jgi:hypothetical protein
MKAWIANALACSLAATAAAWTPPVRAQVALPAPPPSPAEARPPAAAAPSAARPASTLTRRDVALVAAAVAAAGAATGAVFGVLALRSKSEYANGPTYAIADQGNNDAAYADGGLLLAIAAGVTSLVLLLTSGDPQDASGSAPTPRARAAALTASPLATAHGGGAGIALRF